MEKGEDNLGFTRPKITFSWYDYSLFSFMLILSGVIGIYFGCFGKKQKTADEYLLGGKKMKVIPIAMSLVASTVSGIALLAIPADVYRFGATYWLSTFAIIISAVLVMYVYIPVFYKLQVTSMYEYLQVRFDTRMRLCGSLLYALAVLLYLPIVIYVPALALAQATDINLHYITPIICGVCIFYTTIGGLKAVVWTDLLQFSVTIGAMGTVLYLGISSAGGITEIFHKASEGGRLDIDYDWNITKRDTFWGMMVGWMVSSINISQSYMQKYLSVPTLKDAQKTLWYFILGMIVIKTTVVMTGLIMYAKYADCDPFSTGAITKPDQLLPYYVMDVAGNIPGLPGLFIAGVFCAALSTLSSVMNCLAGTLYEDFISRFMQKDITQQSVSNILKLIVVIIGVVSTSLVFIVQYLGGILPLAISFSSVTSGPLLGVFTLGILFPKANAKGAFYGTLTSVVFISWLLCGSQWYKSQGTLQYVQKPTSIAGCNATDILAINNSTMTLHDFNTDIFWMYKISFYYYTLISAAVSISVGLLVSWYTAKKDDKPVHKDLLCPLIHFMLKDDNKDNEVNYYSIDKALHIVTLKDFNK